jgi:hypothetical protein
MTGNSNRGSRLRLVRNVVVLPVRSGMESLATG